MDIKNIVRIAVDKEISNDVNLAKVLADYAKKINDNFFGWHSDVIHQKWEGLGKSNIYDAYGFSEVHMMFMLGHIAVMRICVKSPPSGDKQIDENNKILNRLPNLFAGEFWGGTQDEDGCINMHEQAAFTVVGKDKFAQVNCGGYFPLEVGYINASKTKLYLNSREGKLARWPYGSQDVFLLQNVLML